MHSFRRRGFTLIELLIVVAIIAILAAIAVPNFLEAQTRAKVSRAKADMRSIATAIEAYRIDANAYPPAHEVHNQVSWGLPAAVVTEPNGPFHSRVPSHLSTPIAYITSLPQDPFRANAQMLTGNYLSRFDKRFIWFNFPFNRIAFPASFPNGTFGHATVLAGEWLLYSPGPDKDEFNLVVPLNGRRVYIDYDATNGTLSAGNIFRTQSNGERLGVDPYFYQ